MLYTYPYQQPSQSKTMKTEYTQQSSQQPYCKKPTYDQQFHSIYAQITAHEFFPKLSKHDKIRINKWLTKLSNISTNDLWKKNRNNYIKLIRLMFDCEVVIAPFMMMPPERDLHKLTTHEINVIIDQVDKIVEDRESKVGGNGSNNMANNKYNKVVWMQESAYVNHQSNSIDKYKECENDTRKTYDTSSVTVNATSKLTQLQSPSNQIPPKYPSSKSPINPKSPLNSKKTQPQKQTYNIKQSQQHTINLSKASKPKSRQQQLVEPQSLSPQNYFRKKQRLNTFETEDPQQDQYMDPSREGNSPVVYEKDHYDIGQHYTSNFVQNQSRQAINILKCGFRLLEKLPLDSIEGSSIKEIQTFRKIIGENDFLKHDLQKESRLLDLLSERGNNRAVLNQINSLNNTQKINLKDKRKTKLTLISQTHRNQSLKPAN